MSYTDTRITTQTDVATNSEQVAGNEILADIRTILDAKSSVTLANAVSLGASFNSDALTIGESRTGCLDIAVTTSNAVGAFRLQGSPDGSIWRNLDTTDEPISVSSSSINFPLDILMTGFKYHRVTYTRVSGTGTVTIVGHSR